MNENIIKKVVAVSLVGNIILTLIKLSFGIAGNSNSLVTDGFNSFFDIFVSLSILFVLKVATKEPDKNHPYGHQKYEGIMYLLISFIIILTAIFFYYLGISNLITAINNNSIVNKPEVYTIIVAIIAIIIKVVLFIITYKTNSKYQSSSLKAETKNHFFDILSTTTSLIGIILARFNLIYFEPIATIIIASFIFYTGFSMIKEAISFLVDEAPSKDIIKEINKTILLCPGVVKIDDLKARKHMDKIFVDVEISVDYRLSLIEAHQIAEDVHNLVEEEFAAIHCMVHVNPSKIKLWYN